jgi:hypothetical protein
VSHYSLIKIRIKNPNIALLKKAVEELAKEEGGKTVKEIHDYYGNARTDFVIAIVTPTFHRGVGIKVNNGNVEIVGDFWGINDSEIQKLQEKIVQHYTANAVTTALSTMNYNVKKEKIKDQIVIEGWRW